jgi:hypothetical protein
VRTERFDGSGHGPFLDALDHFTDVFFDFLPS